nr:hypothetical protein [uncultured Oscillibacter sp.]
MQNLVKIAGRYFDVYITAVKRSHEITDGENAGRTMPPQALMIRDIIGTFIPYTITFETKKLAPGEYDALVETLSQPVDSISITMPYGQSEISFDAYVTKVEDELLSNIHGIRRWGNLQVTFTPMAPNIKP